MDVLQMFSVLPSAATLAYVTIWAVIAADVFVPPLPGEGTVVAATALAVTGHLNLGLVVLAAVLGSWSGDLVCYHAGRGWRLRPRPRLERLRRRAPGRTRRFLSRWRRRLRANWRDLFARRGMLVILACRFVPAGRTAASFSAGTMRYPRGRFVVASLLASTIWVVPLTVFGLLSGQVLPNGKSAVGLLPVAEAVMFGVSVTIGVRLWRRLFSSRDAEQAEVAEATAPGGS